MPWEAPPAGDRVLAAFDALRTSVPAALPGSVRRSGRWYRPGTTADAMAAYRAPGAPVPANATVAIVDDGVLSVTYLGRQSGIFLRAEPDGCSYVITPGPSLTVSGSGTPLDGTHFARVGPFPYNNDPAGRGFVAVVTIAGTRWLAFAGAGEGDDGKPDPEGGMATAAALAAAGQADKSGDSDSNAGDSGDDSGTSSGDGDGASSTAAAPASAAPSAPAGVLKGTADLSRADDGAVTAVVHGAAATATITAYLTDSSGFSIAALQPQTPPPPAQ